MKFDVCRPVLAAMLFLLSVVSLAQESAVPAAAPAPTPAPVATGTLVVDIPAFTSEVKLKSKIQRQLESGGIEWGQKDDRIVFTMVNKRFVNFDIPNFTRYGETKELQLPPGEYRITCVGLVMHTAFSPEAVLNKGGYFNEDVMTVRIEAGKTTTLKVQPIIRKQGTFFLNFFVPEMLATTTMDGITSEPVSLNAQTDKSIKWPAYQGDLKFKR